MAEVRSARPNIAFQELGVAGVLKAYHLQVPLNQREYRWEVEHVTQLFQDLTAAMSDEEPEYFLGTVVTIPKDLDSLEVVDGQQRLTTVAIFLAEIRNYLLEHNEGLLAESVEHDFLIVIDRERRERKCKISLNVDDNEFFRAMMDAKPGQPLPQPVMVSHKLIKSAFIESKAHIEKVLSVFDVKQHGNVLNRWIRYLEHSARVILLKVPTEANAYKMFETLNDRGLETSQADLVKNFLLKQSKERNVEAQQKWGRMRSVLETQEQNSDITITFLRQAMIAIGGHLREDQVYEAVQAKAKGPQTAVEFLSQLEALASIYVAIFNSDHERWNAYPSSIRRAIQTLNILRLKGLRPLQLAIAAKFDPKEASEAYRMLITWGVRLVVASTTSKGSVEEPLANAAHSVFSGELITASKLRNVVKGIIPVDEEFRKAFEIASVSKSAFARYYLRSLEMAAKNEATPWFVPNDDQQTINLEHVLPVDPLGNWPQFDPETAQTYARKLGNQALMLAKTNSDLKSSSFELKREAYAESPYELTRMIAKYATWTPSYIAERQKILAELALKAWPL
jgi:hypothetical protein